MCNLLGKLSLTHMPCVRLVVLDILLGRLEHQLQIKNYCLKTKLTHSSFRSSKFVINIWIQVYLQYTTQYSLDIFNLKSHNNCASNINCFLCNIKTIFKFNIFNDINNGLDAGCFQSGRKILLWAFRHSILRLKAVWIVLLLFFFW